MPETVTWVFLLLRGKLIGIGVAPLRVYPVRFHVPLTPLRFAAMRELYPG